MADARICDCCRKVFGHDEKVDKPQYRLYVRNREYDYCCDDRVRAVSEYKEPELCPACTETLFDLIHNSKFANIDK